MSCPAYFSDVQRDVLAAAGGDAGLVVLDTIDEPVVRETDTYKRTERRKRERWRQGQDFWYLLSRCDHSRLCWRRLILLTMTFDFARRQAGHDYKLLYLHAKG